MKITSFNPVVITRDPEAVAGVFEALGFEKKHNPAGTSAVGNKYEAVRMKDANGFYMDIAFTSAPMERDLTAIRVNVDDFDEALHGAIPSGRGGKDPFIVPKRRMESKPAGPGVL